MAASIRATLCTLALFAVALTVAAENTVSICAQITGAGNISIDQPEALARLLEYSPAAIVPEHGDDDGEHQRATATARTGYRIQVFDDNNPRTARSEAENTNRRVCASFPALRSYMSFNSPYWRVKVGDFRTRGEAEAAMAEIRAALPYLAPHLRVVRDKINIVD